MPCPSLWPLQAAAALDDVAAGLLFGLQFQNALSLGLLQHPLAMTPSGVFVNWAKLPAWQRWMPTYRVGYILTLDHANNKCDVVIPDQYSDGGIKINPEGAEASVPKDAIAGWENYAERYPADPLVINTTDSTIPLTDQLKTDMYQVNNNVNFFCTYVSDLSNYDKLEHWAVMDMGGTGDCEDFALLKAHELLKLGYPASAIKIEVGTASNGQGHAWVVVQTDDGDYALDINYSSVMRNEATNYTGRQRQTGTEWSVTGLKLTGAGCTYMRCNSRAFNVGDAVVVEFTSQSWGSPKVIGFAEGPKRCTDYDIGFLNNVDEDVPPYESTVQRISVINEEYVYEYQKLNEFKIGATGAINVQGLGWSTYHQAYFAVEAVQKSYNEFDCVVRYYDETGSMIGEQPVMSFINGNFSSWVILTDGGTSYIYTCLYSAQTYIVGSYLTTLKHGVSINTVSTYNPVSYPYSIDEFGVTMFVDGTLLYWVDFIDYTTPTHPAGFRYVKDGATFKTVNITESSENSGTDILFAKEVGDKLIYCALINRGSFTQDLIGYDDEGNPIYGYSHEVTEEATELRLCNDKLNPLSYTVLAEGDTISKTFGTGSTYSFTFASAWYDAEFIDLDDPHYIVINGGHWSRGDLGGWGFIAPKLQVFKNGSIIDEVDIHYEDTYIRFNTSHLCRVDKVY